jgi:flagella basal body P-ring formation protein FlgA
MMTLAAFALAACLAVNPVSDKITALDLAPAFPDAALVDPGAEVAFAPVPGAQRIFRGADLRRIAGLFGVDAPTREICVERKSAPLDPERLIESMRARLPGARVELLDYGRQPAPEGELDFPLAGLRDTPAGAIWRGWVLYGGGRRFAIWAKVKAEAPAARVVATEKVKAGAPVSAAALRVEMRNAFAASAGFAASIEDVEGRVARRPVAPGEALRLDWFDPPKDVLRGDSVHVEVAVGNTRIEAEAVAESSGKAGDRILVRNPESNKRFMAKVEGKGRVSVGKENQ